MWTSDDSGLDVTSTFKGLTTPIRDLYNAINGRGWEVSKVKWGSNGYEAEAKNPASGQKLKKTGPTECAAVAHLLLAITRLDYVRTYQARRKLGMWQTTFTDKLEVIAKAYSEAPTYDPKAVGAWIELAHDSVRRAEVLKTQLHIEVVDDPEPYANSQEMCEDIHKNKHFFVSRANSNHPVWSVEQNVAFRIVHDVMGHCASGGDFGWQGENLACSAHFPLLSPNAQKALFTECIAQTAYAIYYRGFGPQKVAFLDDLIEKVQQEENPVGHQGIHPSQSTPPIQTPQVPASQPQSEVSPFPKGWGLQPHVEDAINQTQQVFSVFHKNAGYVDPNRDWTSGVEPLLGPNGRTWREVENDPLGIHRPNEKGVTAWDVAHNLGRIDPHDHDLRWWHRDPETDEYMLPRPEMKKAIVNAFAAVLLSPRKDLRWNTIHYQDLADIVHTTEDPNYLHKRLDQRRVEWNRNRKISPLAHKPYYREQQDFAMYLKATNPGMTDRQAQAKAAAKVRLLLEEEKSKIARELEVKETNKPPEKRTTLSQIEIKAGAEVARILRDIMNPTHNAETDHGDQLSMFGSATKFEDNYVDDLAEKILNECSDDEVPDGISRAQTLRLFRAYALLALTKGKDTTMEDVHDAWAAWTAEREPDHDSLVPFDDLSKKIQEYDRPYMEYIHKHATRPVHPPSQMSIEAPQDAEIDPSIVEMFDGSINPEAMGAYGAWMGEHLKPISIISRHAEGILDAALKDIEEHDGSGHHFRAYVLSLNISGVGPKVTSFAWLLLAPELSELATIDTHMMDVLGYKGGDVAPSPRDYFKMERQFRARLDAAGYHDLPLGLGQWAMWDYKRTGRDTHQDHAGLRPLNFVQHDYIDWNAKAPNTKGSDAVNDPWWKETEGIGDQVGQHFDQTIGHQFAANEIPFRDDPRYVPVRTAAAADEFHIAWMVPQDVRRKLADWTASLDWPEGFELEEPDQYHITAVYAQGGWNDKINHRLIKDFPSSDLPFEVTKLDLFGPDNDVVVLRLSSKEATKWATKLMDEAEALGLDVSRYDGGYKAHITLGKATSLPEGDDCPVTSFRGGKLYISRPRKLVEKEPEEHPIFSAVTDPAPSITHPDGESDVGAPGETIMQYLRGQLGMSTEQAWEFAGRVEKVR